MDCGIQQRKKLLYIFNFVLAVWGIISLVIGVTFRMKASSETAAGTTTAANILISIGCILFFFSICRSFAFRHNNCYVFLTYACSLMMLMVAQIGIAIAVLVQSRNGGSIQSNLEYSYTTSFPYYWEDPLIGTSIDDIQVNYQCCGIDGMGDFYKLERVIPSSCCDRLSHTTSSRYAIYPRGCLNELKEWVAWSGSVCGGILLGIAAFELVDIVLVFLLVKALRNAERGGYVY